MSTKQAPSPLVLATDLDGTLIPLDADPHHRRALAQIKDEHSRETFTLVFVTGRHFESVEHAIAEYELPRPDFIICDVGTSMLAAEGNGFVEVAAYPQHLQSLVGDWTVQRLEQAFASIDGLRLQESEKQGPYKLSYYADAEQLPELVTHIHRVLHETSAPYTVIASVDPFNGDGLVDLLPAGVSKAYALEFWSREHARDTQSILFAGDSGNDLAALTAGYRSIVVGNASDVVRQQVQTQHQQNGWTDRLFLADQTATSGVLQGLRHFAG